MISKPIGSRMGFSGGAEPTPIVEVGRFHARGSLNDNAKTLYIEQDGKTIILSDKTMESILKWARES